MHALFLVLLCATSFQAVRKAPPSFRSSQCIMGSPGRWILWTVCACLAARQKAALRVTMREASLEVVRGDSVLLPCSFFTSSDFSRLNVIWTLAPFSSPETPVQVIVYDHRQVIKNPSLIGRVDFTGLPSRADIMLNDTHVSDGGIYRCMVNNPPDTADPGVGELLLSVLEPPSLPVCEWDGDVDVGGSVRLSCSVEEGVPTPEIRWEKVDPEEISLPINMDGELSGSVQIVNVSSQTSGLYRCSAANALGTQNCYVKLAVYRSEGSRCGRRVGRAAGRAADAGDEPGAAGPAGARRVAASHGPGREEREEEEEEEVEGAREGRGRGVLQRDTLHPVPHEALFCLTGGSRSGEASD
ncbi:immunoglobulin superfamily member 11 isoform X2 [Fundulus heteroclitus]|uniref:immunoglobulin superfamily member 11 isoform X2 n=1 Tax=Fundulus heteroclitus TaxID=8078 RepID=UPI00165B7883|nr:immunoglobulin superfamily member 11 isoform X2 [Fundulus heteroclitus]